MYVSANSVDSDQTALKEQSDQDLHCLPFFLHLLEALLHRKIKLFYIKDNYGSWSGCPNTLYLEFLRYLLISWKHLNTFTSRFLTNQLTSYGCCC